MDLEHQRRRMRGQHRGERGPRDRSRPGGEMEVQAHGLDPTATRRIRDEPRSCRGREKRTRSSAGVISSAAHNRRIPPRCGHAPRRGTNPPSQSQAAHQLDDRRGSWQTSCPGYSGARFSIAILMPELAAEHGTVTAATAPRRKSSFGRVTPDRTPGSVVDTTRSAPPLARSARAEQLASCSSVPAIRSSGRVQDQPRAV